MSYHIRTLWVTIGAMVLLCAPALSSAQDVSSDWTHIRKFPSRCQAELPCPSKAGLIWDSTDAVPAYPTAMQHVGVGGELVLAFGVREDGRVDSGSVTILRASNQAFVPSALAAVRGWHFAVEAAGRPAGVLPVEMHLIYSHEGVCDGVQQAQHVGWAAWNQLVIGVCTARIPRSQSRQPR